jgi:hypothetical protein
MGAVIWKAKTIEVSETNTVYKIIDKWKKIVSSNTSII